MAVVLVSLGGGGQDPFVLREAPDVYFAACEGAAGVASRLVRGPAGQTVRTVALPPFARTGRAALVDLGSLEVTELCFSAGL
eukprot:CAMPEP_0206362560 /NCGR_PEP_ID=MMETSP0294-20121207/1053_1 /ASSEMBLY_ACC=CAM_ASM_000327 /TAXON_ID=39354 /ORGANISM="Heterosigma akashiwo, Strain CCMP2393" /LENGTH=81 /DNA_ID=CAMNT_0053807705 /DNA_START=685 /DNA_END=931 /DNA_ORIENTATION=-